MASRWTAASHRTSMANMMASGRAASPMREMLDGRRFLGTLIALPSRGSACGLWSVQCVGRALVAPKETKDLSLVVGEFGCHRHVAGAVVGQFDRHDAGKAHRPRRGDVDAVGQVDGFVGIVGDEDHRLLELTLDAE